MGRSHIHKQIMVRAPLEHVFERITDHEAMADWPGVSWCRLIREGEPRNGVGAVREMKVRGLTLQEEVVRFEPPEHDSAGYDYTIIKGLPVEHLGKVRLVSTKAGVRVTWEIELGSRIPLLAQTIGLALDRGLGGALRHFRREAERTAPAGEAPAKKTTSA